MGPPRQRAEQDRTHFNYVSFGGICRALRCRYIYLSALRACCMVRSAGHSDYSCQQCPPFSRTRKNGSASIAQCKCVSSYFDSDTSPAGVVCVKCRQTCPASHHLSGTCATHDYACAPCRSRASCAADHYLAGACGGHADYSCARCPANSSSLVRTCR